ncbi:C1 family peptidase [Kaistella sp. G5-32]|uniref:C1 family peptidase n=1 Tax=Kaistella gelatinilytica TaxID=2787636 RepID=A0ABS0F8F2_9FLAO|nr:C1 family peptidase [Kaistella gelatinilytica]MBF8455957.1 C1 family peptidase [Kaistella gelatinilytica]
MAKQIKKKSDPTEHLFGWIPDVPDQRDLMYSAPLSVMKSMTSKINLRSMCPPVYDQGQLGSCTANGLGAAFQFGQMKQKLKSFTPSRLFLYYNERVMINTVNSDSGAFIRDGIKSLNTDGVCSETLLTYNIAKFTKKPSLKCYSAAHKNTIQSYMRLNNSSLFQLQSCLSDGYPFVFGFTVYESFRTIGKDGIMPMPTSTEARLGGHCVMAVGYDDSKQLFIVRNSWGESWADKGYFYMPYAFITNNHLCDDFWTIRLLTPTKVSKTSKTSKK